MYSTNSCFIVYSDEIKYTETAWVNTCILISNATVWLCIGQTCTSSGSVECLLVHVYHRPLSLLWTIIIFVVLCSKINSASFWQYFVFEKYQCHGTRVCNVWPSYPQIILGLWFSIAFALFSTFKIVTKGKDGLTIRDIEIRILELFLYFIYFKPIKFFPLNADER